MNCPHCKRKLEYITTQRTHEGFKEWHGCRWCEKVYHRLIVMNVYDPAGDGGAEGE